MFRESNGYDQLAVNLEDAPRFGYGCTQDVIPARISSGSQIRLRNSRKSIEKCGYENKNNYFIGIFRGGILYLYTGE